VQHSASLYAMIGLAPRSYQKEHSGDYVASPHFSLMETTFQTYYVEISLTLCSG
jgi:hypothetical protein